MYIAIGIKRARLEQFHEELTRALLADEPIELTLDANMNVGSEHVEVIFDTSDMEDTPYDALVDLG